MGGNTLLVRHLPASLTSEEKEDLLRHFGAIRVRVMGNRGPLKHAAFAEFSSKEVAVEVLKKLHQVEVLGCKLVVEIARDKDSIHFPTVSDSQPAHRTQDKDEVKKKQEEKDGKEDEIESNAFDFSFLQWGVKEYAYWYFLRLMVKLRGPLFHEESKEISKLKYPRKRRLYYLYPPPSPSILTNISHALAACPKFYVQVLHLMNKMDLPAPFGPVTPQPPLAPDTAIPNDNVDLLQAEEMDVSSTEESEIESDTEMVNSAVTVPVKRKSRNEKRMIKKQVRLAMKQSQVLPDTKSSGPAISMNEVFEQIVESSSHKKIQLCLPANVTVAEDISQINSGATAKEPEPVREVQTGGFGVITPVMKPAEEKEENVSEKEWTKTKFISDSELQKGKISRREMENFSVFRNYQEGEPSRRLYIKNLAKQVTEEDLHWIFGRYVNWDDEGEKIIFDIRLMKEGRMKGQAFVTLPNENGARHAVKDANGFVLKGKPMAVQFARSAKLQDEG